MSNIHTAVAKVLAEIHRLKKGDKNDHGKYAYVSVDDVKDHVRPLLAQQGLHISVTETAFDMISVEGRNGVTTCARISYAITLRHVSGEALPPDIITIVLPYTGAQTAGAARSYAVKEWKKSTLLVSTGEKDVIVGGVDADAYAQQDYVAEKPAVMPAVNGTPGASKAASRPAFEKMISTIRNAATLRALGDWYEANVKAIDALPPDWLDELRMEYVDRQSDLKKTLAA